MQMDGTHLVAALPHNPSSSRLDSLLCGRHAWNLEDDHVAAVSAEPLPMTRNRHVRCAGLDQLDKLLTNREMGGTQAELGMRRRILYAVANPEVEPRLQQIDRSVQLGGGNDRLTEPDSGSRYLHWAGP
jgi:hypothetical protein